MSAAPHLTTLLLLSLPPSTFVGMDLFSFTMPPTSSSHRRQFRGIKLIPQGLHHLYYSPGPYSDFTPRTGLWFRATGNPGSVIILKWDSAREQLIDESLISAEELGRVNGQWVGWWGDGSLIEYRARGTSGVASVADSRVWRELVGDVNERTLDRVLGSGTGSKPDRSMSRVVVMGGEKKIWWVSSTSSAPQDRDDDILSSIHLRNSADNHDVTMSGADNAHQEKEVDGTDFNGDQSLSFLPIDLKRTFPPNSTGRERTIAATDRTWYLNHLIITYLNPHTDTELLAELQLTYLLALTLSNFSSSEAWKRLLSLILTCESRIVTHSSFFGRALDILVTQLGPGLDCFAPPRQRTGGEEDGEDEPDGAGVGTYVPEFLADSSPAFDIQRLLRGFLRTLKRVQEDLPPPPTSREVFDHHRHVEGLLGRFATLEDLASKKFGWTLDASKVVKKGMVQLEDGEMVELELAGLLDEEEDEEDRPVVVEL